MGKTSFEEISFDQFILSKMDFGDFLREVQIEGFLGKLMSHFPEAHKKWQNRKVDLINYTPLLLCTEP